MKTDVIAVSGAGEELAAALAQAEKVAAYKGLSPKGALHLRLLTEEMMGMMRAITGERSGQFWIEDEDSEYRLHLRVHTRMDSGKRSSLLSVATSGKNESARGLMGSLLDFFERGADEDVAAAASPLMLAGMSDFNAGSVAGLEWSMARAQSALSADARQNEARARAAWDELEKSVVAHVADDVRVSIRGQQVEMTIIKKLA